VKLAVLYLLIVVGFFLGERKKKTKIGAAGKAKIERVIV
jgi:hypothetical protein